MFKTKYDRERVYTEHGSRIAPVFSLASKEAGKLDLKITGEEDIYAKIQSYAQSVDIHNILLRYKMGETDILNKFNGTFIDVSDMPTSFAEIMNTVITAENNFNELPLEVRKAYDFSPAQYIADIGSDKWLNVLGIKSNEEAKEIGEKKEVKEDGKE